MIFLDLGKTQTAFYRALSKLQLLLGPVAWVTFSTQEPWARTEALSHLALYLCPVGCPKLSPLQSLGGGRLHTKGVDRSRQRTRISLRISQQESVKARLALRLVARSVTLELQLRSPKAGCGWRPLWSPPATSHLSCGRFQKDFEEPVSAAQVQALRFSLRNL